MAFEIKQNDTRPKLQTTLAGFGGGANLSTASSVTFKMRLTGGAAVTLGGTTTIVTPASNIVRYTWATGDTAVVGDYQGEWEILWNDGGVETVPNNAYDDIIIYDDIS